MADTNIDLAFFDNEDASRTFTLKSGTADSSTPYDLTAVTFEADIRDQKNALVLHLSTDTDGGIAVTDAAAGVFSINISRGQITYQASRSLQYDLLMIVGGERRRLWGGSVRVMKGTTQ